VELLLVLDNFEHLAAEAPLLADLLAAAPHCKLLVTSRQQLDLVEEWVYALHGLPLPPELGATASVQANASADVSQNTTENIEENSAVALFVCSARRSSHDFALDDSNRAAVVRICRLVGGMPLAIELAAGWVRLLTCGEIAVEVGRSLDLLAAAQRNLPERHRSIRAVFDYSWRLLSEDEQAALAALSVFAGGFERDAALAVANAGLPMLMALTARSLVQRVDAGRLSLHELVRQYALEQLVSSPHWSGVRDRHLAWLAELSEGAREGLYGAEQREWLVRLEREHANLRAALEWAFGEQQPQGERYAGRQARVEEGLRMVAGSPRFWNGRGYLVEGTGWLRRGLAAAPECNRAVRAEALSTLGWLVNMLGDTPEAKRLQLESLALFRACGDEYGMAEALDALGDSAWFEGALAEAKTYYGEGLALRRRLGNPVTIGLALYSLGRLEVDHGSPDAAGLALVADSCNQPLRAARLLGAASAMRAVTGARFSVDEEALSQLLLCISEQPDQHAALQEGNRCSQEQAVAYALSSEP
jgi:predicted ATPase